MPTEIRFPLTDSQPLCRALRSFGLVTFEALAEQIRSVPYGRPQKPDELLSVLTENRGTCSGKHRLLAAVAHECGRSEIELIVGIYAMSEDNTPGVGGVLQSAGVMSIPEAHCYLATHGRRLDFTGLGSGSASSFDALLAEHVVSPQDLPTVKTELHHRAIANWAVERGMDFASALLFRQ